MVTTASLILLKIHFCDCRLVSIYAPPPTTCPARHNPRLSQARVETNNTSTLRNELCVTPGMDAYCLIRFNYLCLRISLFAAFWGMLVLTPLYINGKGTADGIYVITMANVESGSPKLVSSTRVGLRICSVAACWIQVEGTRLPCVGKPCLSGTYILKVMEGWIG